LINARTDVYLRGFGAPETRLGCRDRARPCVPRRGSRLRLRAGVTSADTIRSLVEGIGGPVNILAVKGSPSIAQLEALGVARVSVGSGPHRATLALTRDIARELKDHGTYDRFTTHALRHDETNELMR